MSKEKYTGEERRDRKQNERKTDMKESTIKIFLTLMVILITCVVWITDKTNDLTQDINNKFGKVITLMNNTRVDINDLRNKDLMHDKDISIHDQKIAELESKVK